MPDLPHAAWRRRRVVPLIALALTIVNAIKPMCVDDAAYCQFARQIAAHPGDPYGFEHDWYQWPIPATHVLAPPVFLFWWGAGIWLWGESPLAAKLWIFPWNLLFVAGLAGLLRRFARGLETPILAMTVFSPLVLPSVNMMLDIPALGLGLASLVVFLAASDSGSWGRAAVAGLLAGLAIETKYTAFVFPALFLFRGALPLAWRRGADGWRPAVLGMLAAAFAGIVFVGCEAWIASKYGESHFVVNRRITPPGEGRFALLGPFLAFGGAASPMLIPLGLAALGARRSAIQTALIATLAAFALLAIAPVEWLSFYSLGAGWLAIVVAAAHRLTVRRSPNARRLRADMVAWFLLGWWGLEAAYYFAVTPFPAGRRLLGVTIVTTLLIGRLASRARPRALLPTLAGRWAMANALLGLMAFGVDALDAYAPIAAIQQATTVIGSRAAGKRVWYLGHWGFQYYAERAGWTPLRPDSSARHPGDWVVAPTSPWWDMSAALLPPCAADGGTPIRVEDAVPFAAVPSFYLGRFPLKRRTASRLEASAFRVAREFVPWTPVDIAASWATHPEKAIAVKAIPALAHWVEYEAGDKRAAALIGLARLGPSARGASDAIALSIIRSDDPGYKRLAIEALLVIGAEPSAIALLKTGLDGADPEAARVIRAALSRLEAAPATPTIQ